MSVIISCLNGYCTPVQATIGRFYLLLLVVASFSVRLNRVYVLWVRGLDMSNAVLLLCSSFLSFTPFVCMQFFPLVLYIFFFSSFFAGVHYSGLSHPLCTTCTPFSMKFLLHLCVWADGSCSCFVFNIILLMNRVGAIMFKGELASFFFFVSHELCSPLR